MTDHNTYTTCTCFRLVIFNSCDLMVLLYPTSAAAACHTRDYNAGHCNRITITDLAGNLLEEKINISTGTLCRFTTGSYAPGRYFVGCYNQHQALVQVREFIKI